MIQASRSCLECRLRSGMAGWGLPEAAAGRAGPGLAMAPGLKWGCLGCTSMERFGAWGSCGLASDQGV